MKQILARIALTLVILEGTYLILVNLALNLPVTQSLINEHRPEKYALRWSNAWSWYPLRVHARGVSANGQTLSQQWQADALAASASVALAPLFRKKVRIHGFEVENVSFRLRPRPKPGKDYAKIREFFPTIENRNPNSPAAARHPPKAGEGWKIVVDGIEAEGRHDVWVYQVRALFDGSLQGNVSYQTRGGPVSLTGGKMDVQVGSLTVDRDWEVSSDAGVTGKFDLTPFVPADNPGIKSLGFLNLTADIDAPVDSLRFLDIYLRELNAMQVDGKGRLRGHLRYEQGNLMSGTEIRVDAQEMTLRAASYELVGEGGVDIAVSEEEPKTLSLGIVFGALEAKHQDDRSPLFSGTGLGVRARGSSRILVDAERDSGGGDFAVTIPSVRVPDLRLYQRYVPKKWDVEIKGGKGALQGEVKVSASRMSSELYLASGDAELRVRGFRFRTNLDLGLQVRGGTSETASVDLSGTYLSLDGARLTSTERGTTSPWHASLAISQGTLGVPIPDGRSGDGGYKHLSDVFKKKGFKYLLASADAQLKADLVVSDLEWVNLLFSNPFDLAVSGAGTMETNLIIQEGWIAEGTSMRAEPEGLQIQVLDYVAQGEGDVTLDFTRGGETPDLRLDAKLAGANLKRRGEKQAVVEDVALEVSALATGVAFDGSAEVAGVELRIPEARVTDMTVYNQFLPENLPFKLLGGEAALTADVRLAPKSAIGTVNLVTKALRTRLDEQEVSGELTLDIKLKDGVPKDMRFDISGSSLKLDRVRVAGKTKGFSKSDWNARFDLRKANVVWKKPMRLDLEAGIDMTDSSPIVAVFANQRGKAKWVDKLLTVEGISGKAELKVDAERALVPYALVGSDEIDVGAKGLVDRAAREGIFYARFRKLHGVLKVKGGDRNFDILGAKEKFDAYVPGATSLRLTGGDPAKESDASPVAGTKTSQPPTGAFRWKWPKRDASGKGSYESFMSD